MPDVHVIIAPDCYTGTLTAAQAAAAMAEGWARTAPRDRLTLVPLSDGGPGFVDVLAASLDGEVHAVVTTDPLGREVPGDDPADDRRRRPHGIRRVGAGGRAAPARARRARPHPHDDARRRHPGARRARRRRATHRHRSRRLGHQRRRGGPARRPRGRTGCAARPRAASPSRPRPRTTSPGSTPPADRLRGVDLVIASDVDSPLLGLKGASAVFGAAEGRLGGGRPTARERAGPLRERRRPGAPAGQGPAHRHPAQARARARRRSRRRARLRPAPARGAPGLRGRGRARRGRLRRPRGLADLVVTGEGSFDWQSLRGKVVVGVAEAAARVGVPVIAVPGPVARRPPRGDDAPASRGCMPSRSVPTRSPPRSPSPRRASRTGRRAWRARGRRPHPEPRRAGRMHGSVGGPTYPVGRREHIRRGMGCHS